VATATSPLSSGPIIVEDNEYSSTPGTSNSTFDRGWTVSLAKLSSIFSEATTISGYISTVSGVISGGIQDVEQGNPIPPGTGEDDDSRDDLIGLGAVVPDHLRRSAWLHYVDGMSHDEVGRALGLSRRTIFNYLADFHARARRFLRIEP
jgi:hypothetical protein